MIFQRVILVACLIPMACTPIQQGSLHSQAKNPTASPPKTSSAQEPFACPEGTAEKTTRDQDLEMRYCARPDGTQHGPVHVTEKGTLVQTATFDAGKLTRQMFFHEQLVSTCEADRECTHSLTCPEGTSVKERKRGSMAYPDQNRTNALGCERPDGTREGYYYTWGDYGTQRGGGLYRDGKRDGMWVFLDKYGEPASVGSYTSGLRQGLWLITDTQNNLFWQGEYDQDVPTGAWTWEHLGSGKVGGGTLSQGQATGEWKIPCGLVRNSDVKKRERCPSSMATAAANTVTVLTLRNPKPQDLDLGILQRPL